MPDTREFRSTPVYRNIGYETGKISESVPRAPFSLEGPASIEEETTTIVVPANDTSRYNPAGFCLLEVNTGWHKDRVGKPLFAGPAQTYSEFLYPITYKRCRDNLDVQYGECVDFHPFKPLSGFCNSNFPAYEIQAYIFLKMAFSLAPLESYAAPL